MTWEDSRLRSSSHRGSEWTPDPGQLISALAPRSDPQHNKHSASVHSAFRDSVPWGLSLLLAPTAASLTNLFLWPEFQAVQLLLVPNCSLTLFLCFLTLFFSFPIDLSMSPCSWKVCVKMNNFLDRRTGEGKENQVINERRVLLLHDGHD